MVEHRKERRMRSRVSRAPYNAAHSFRRVGLSCGSDAIWLRWNSLMRSRNLVASAAYSVSPLARYAWNSDAAWVRFPRRISTLAK